MNARRRARLHLHWPAGHVLALAGLAMAGLAAAQTAGRHDIDPEHSRFEFELRTRWGQKLLGEFPRFEGHVTDLPDGRQQAQVTLHAADIRVNDHPRYTELARGRSFFDVARHPQVRFVSDPYVPDSLAQGGLLQGTLQIRGVSRRQVMQVQAAACENPGRDCEVVATASLNRSDFGMDDHKLAIGDRVVFVMRTRLRENPLP